MRKFLFVIFAGIMLAGCTRSYTVTFHTDGTAAESAVLEKGESLGSLPVTEKDGYDFTGWYSDRALTKLWSAETPVEEDTDLYAGWNVQKRTVAFETETTTVIDPITVDYGTIVSLEELTLEKEGMTFTGWYTDAERTIPYTGEEPITEDTTIYAGWEGPIHVELEVKEFINQAAAGAREGCEGASLLMALQMTGHAEEYNYYTFLDEIPYSPDSSPYKGFAGNLWEDTPEIDAMMPGPVTEWGKKYGNTVNMTGCDEKQLISILEIGHPVVVWTSIHFQPSEVIYYEWGTYKSHNHVMLLIGYDEETNRFKIADPAGWNNGIYWVSYDTFMNSWDCYRGAVEVY